MPEKPSRIVLETNYGGLGVNICGCGVLLLTTDNEPEHTKHCPTYREHMENQHEDHA